MRKKANYSIQYGDTYALPADFPSKVAVLAVFLGTVLFFIACCTPHWSTGNNGSKGIWVSCENDQCDGHLETAALRTAQVFAILGLAIALMTSLMSSSYFVVKRFRGRKVTCSTNIVLSAFAVLSILVCLCLMGLEFNGMRYLNWSFYLGVGGAVSLSVGGLMWFVQRAWL